MNERPTTETSPAFGGFLTGTPAITLPADFFTELMPQIDDDVELRVTLYALYVIGRKRGPLRAVFKSELAGESALLRSLATSGRESLESALAAAVERGTLLELMLDDGDRLFFVNNAGGRRQRERVRNGSLPVPGGHQFAPVPAVERREVTAVYEREIGTLTPAVADALREAEARYPGDWVADALRMAAMNNARSWRYAEAILRRWEAEGRDDETAGGDARPADPYGHVYRRE